LKGNAGVALVKLSVLPDSAFVFLCGMFRALALLAARRLSTSAWAPCGVPWLPGNLHPSPIFLVGISIPFSSPACHSSPKKGRAQMGTRLVSLVEGVSPVPGCCLFYTPVGSARNFLVSHSIFYPFSIVFPPSFSSRRCPPGALSLCSLALFYFLPILSSSSSH